MAINSPITKFPNYPIFSKGSSMLKSDRWIRKMAKEHDMINPFSEKAGARGRRVIWLVVLRIRPARGR